ncbi:unnamed protein product [Amaranthus hypochondriacus]
MGCGSSKLDNLPAVILCRDRLQFLSQALHQRYVFAEAHLAYIHSLQTLSLSLRHFFDASHSIPSLSPVLDLPPERKIAVNDPGSNSAHHLSHSSSGSHIQFQTDSEDEDDHDHNHHIDSGSDSDSDMGHKLLPQRGVGMMKYEESSDNSLAGGGYPYNFNPNSYLYSNNGSGFYNNNNNNVRINYMKKHVTSSVSYEQKPVSYETHTVQYGDPSSSNSSNYHDYFGGGSNNSNYLYNNSGMGMNYGGFYGAPPAASGGYGNLNGGPPPGSQMWGPTRQVTPPPPPPPTTSSWDFLNLFESIENHYPPYTPSRDSWEVREEEGIPDLEDEDNYVHEVVKEVDGNHKLAEDNRAESSISTLGESKIESKIKSKGVDEEVVSVNDEVRARVSVGMESVPVEYEVHVVDKKVVGEEGKKTEQGGKGGREGRPGFRNAFDVVKEIQVQFERAATSGSEIDKVLEVGKLRYQRKNAAYQVSAKMLNVITPSLPSSSKDECGLDLDEDVRLRSVNLSATLQKLYLWEKKLYEEVKAEEHMRVKYDKKLVKINHLFEKGAEPHKIESIRNEARSLSTKIKIAIQVVDKISVKINKVRDEELWPQLNELIQGLSRMWKAMLECHHSQYEAIDGARGLNVLAFPSNPSDTHLEASLQLEHDLLNWTYRFTEWIGAQKSYVRSLNCWLLKCILYEPEETADGIAPFSPGRAGAPPVFVICNHWNQSLERLSETSEKDLIDSMRVFSLLVLQFRERDKGELKQRMTVNRDMERKVKNLDREDVKMQKMILSSGDSDGLSMSGHIIYPSDTSSKPNLQAGLRHVFEAMDKFTSDSVKLYEDLLQRSEEVVRERGRVS